MNKFSLILLLVAFQVNAESFIDTVISCTFRISEVYTKAGATCFLVQDGSNVIVVTNKHVLDGNINNYVDVWKDDFEQNIDIINLSIFKEYPFKVSPICGDISVFYSRHSINDWKNNFKLPNIIQEKDLITISNTDSLSFDYLFVYGYPIDFDGFILNYKKFLKFNSIEKVRLVKKNIEDDCGVLYHGNYKIMNTPGGLSGSPVFFENGIIGVNSGSLVNEYKSNIVPSEYVLEAIKLLKGSRKNEN